MEQLPSNERESGISRVVGFGPEKEKEILEHFRSVFDGNSTDQKEKAKTPEQIVMLERINEAMAEFLQQYGVTAVKIPPENVHIIDEEKFQPEELKVIKKRIGSEHGFYSPFRQGVGLFKDYNKGKLSFLQTLVHEILHLQGFFSYQRSDSESPELKILKNDDLSALNMRRSGFSIGTLDGKTQLFHEINESIITELTIRFERSYFKDWPELAEEMRARDEIIRQFSNQHKVSLERASETVGSLSELTSLGQKWVSYPYHHVRKEFNSLVDELYDKNKEDFESREQIFHLFASAAMNGKLLPIARLIEKTFGKGSFRIAAEKTSYDMDID